VAERLDDLAASWRRDLRAAGKAERTITLYGQSVRFLADWLERQGRSPDVAALTKYTISAWLEDVRGGHAGHPTVRRVRGPARAGRARATGCPAAAQ